MSCGSGLTLTWYRPHACCCSVNMVACRWWTMALWSASSPRWTVCGRFSIRYVTLRMRSGNDGRPSQRGPDLHAYLPGVHHPHLGERLSASVVERVSPYE